MRKRIEQLARGKFEHTKPEVIFSEETVEFSVCEGTDYTGEFTITCKNQIPIRGVVYSANPRMKCLTPQFESRTSYQTSGVQEEVVLGDLESSIYVEPIRIRYQFHSKGLEEGVIERGRFVIVCNQMEISLSFCASVCKQYPQSSYGEIRNLSDFAVLAKENREEAYQIFCNKAFFNLMGAQDIKEQMIYRGILGTRPSISNMEEFLIGTGKKDRISISVEKEKYEFYEVKEVVKDVLEIHKDNWGFAEISITTDAEFIHFEKEVITSDMFLGSVYPLEFYIDAEYMHHGKNYAKIMVTSPYESCAVEIMASTEEKYVLPTIEKTYRIKKKKSLSRIMELYIEYRLKRVVTGMWARETAEILDGLYVMEPEEMMYPLMKAQCLIINQQRQDAEWILDEFKRKWTDRKAPIWGYYLYVRSLMEKEPIFIERLTNEIEEIFEQNKDSALLYWVLLYLKEEYDDDAYKLKRIRSYIKKGCSSPHFYLEAYYLICENPYLLSKLGVFEIRMLRWAIRHKAITKDIALQIFTVMENKKEYSQVVYEILCVAYEANPKPEHVGIICGYLIKANKYEHKYHHWYEMGIEMELRITGLYEAYLLSMDERSIKPVPKVIRKYFRYECMVPYKKLAVLYNNIVASKDADMETYEEYRDTISHFAMEQITLGRMDDNLAVIYEDMLEVGQIGEDTAKALAGILFLRKLVVFDKRMKRAIIYQSQMKEPQIVSIANQSAYFQLISKDYVILFEDENGVRYAGGISYQLQNLMDTPKYMEICRSFAPQELSYILSHFDGKENESEVLPEEEAYLKKIMDSEKVSATYKAKILPKVMYLYQKQGDTTQLLEYLKTADYAKFMPKDRKAAIELLVEHGLYELAYEKVAEYGIDQLKTSSQIALAQYMIERKESEEECLTMLAMEVFRLGEYDPKTLIYLGKYYNGPTKEMLSLWKAGKGLDIKQEALSERLLTQMLYIEWNIPECMPVFDSYYKAKGKGVLILAFLSFCAYHYLVHEEKIKQEIFALIEERMLHHAKLNDACKLGLLCYYAKCSQLAKLQEELADELLGEYTRRNMYFAFYKKFHASLQQKYHVYDKVFLEYRANPNSRVLVAYKSDADGAKFIKEEMQNVYEGIFVKSFVVLFGEMIEYRISEEYNQKMRVMESSRILHNEAYHKADQSRYSLLNQMLISEALQEDADMYYNMKRYVEYEEIAKAVFQLL